MKLSSKTLHAYESFLATLHRDPAHFRNKDFEMDLYGELNPSGSLSRLYFEELRWLNFEEFLQHYLALHGATIINRFGFKSSDEFLPGLRARLYRTQFGFLTEYHAFLLSAVFFGNENVFRSVELDKAGVDFQINLDNRRYNIHIFVDTDRSWSYRNYKSRNKNVDSLPGIHVSLPYSLKEGKFNSVRYLPNGFGIYQASYLDYFFEEARAERLLNNNIIGTTATGFIYR